MWVDNTKLLGKNEFGMFTYDEHVNADTYQKIHVKCCNLNEAFEVVDTLKKYKYKAKDSDYSSCTYTEIHKECLESLNNVSYVYIALYYDYSLNVCTNSQYYFSDQLYIEFETFIDYIN